MADHFREWDEASSAGGDPANEDCLRTGGDGGR